MNDLQPVFKQPKFIASAILVALIVIAGLIIVSIQAFGGGNDETTAPPMTTKSATSSSNCGLPDGDQTLPTSAPEATWNLSGKMAAPANKRFGPGNRDSYPRTCFAHNPTGAVFAAANYLADSANPDVSTKQLVAKRIYEDGNSNLVKGNDDDSGDVMTYQIAGFRVEDATADRVSVAMVIRATEGPHAGDNFALTFTLGWQRGDWRLVVPPNGKPPTSAVTSLSGFIPWAGA